VIAANRDRNFARGKRGEMARAFLLSQEYRARIGKL